jgi:4-amino-4-deoxy-L-arabinose transferase-like glycosyltransferase
MKNLLKRFSEINIFFRLSPFLLLYLIICISFATNEFTGDEERYVQFAHNLLNGFYAPSHTDVFLWNGPGYPLLIASFLFFKLPLLTLKLLNAVLLYVSLIISYQTFNFYSSKKNSLVFTILLGLYFPIFEMIPFLLTETLTWFLISLICFLFIKVYKQKNISWKLILLAALAIAYLAMTKVIFGYVILLMIFASAFMFLLPQFRKSAKKSILVFALSMIFCLPWLIYTYGLTGKVFYWTNSGNMSLYTMSTPYSNELGDWSREDSLSLNPNHKAFMDSISTLSPLQKDAAYKNAALNNIKNHSKKYFSNWIANIGRLLFSYPYSNKQQSINTYFTFLPDMFIVVIITLTFSISIIHYKRFPEGMIFLLLFIFIYLFGCSLVSAYRRMFYITMPFWFLYFSYFFDRIVSIKIRGPER